MARSRALRSAPCIGEYLVEEAVTGVCYSDGEEETFVAMRAS